MVADPDTTLDSASRTQMQTQAQAHPNRGTVLSEFEGRPVFTRDGYRLGDVAGFAVDLEAERASALLVDGVDESRFPNLSVGDAGIRIPYRRLRGVGDAVVVTVPGAVFGDDAAADAESVELSEALADPSATERPVR